jgi:hypothetical protein
VEVAAAAVGLVSWADTEVSAEVAAAVASVDVETGVTVATAVPGPFWGMADDAQPAVIRTTASKIGKILNFLANMIVKPPLAYKYQIINI